MVQNSKMKRITVAVCLALMPFAADAAGLGKLTVISGLGQPLDAEIELLSATKDELSSMSARIAPSDAYSEQGIERASILSSVHVELANRPDGIPVLKITSPQAISDPFLDMLIQVEWSSGRLMREYTALLDPPGFGDQPAAAAVASPVAQDQSASGTDNVSKPMAAAKAPAEKKSKSHKNAVMPKPATDASQVSEATAGEGHVTQHGDTLRGIVSQMPQAEGVSLDQMLVGVYRANPDAFISGNMNRLKVGQIVRQPSAEELQAISKQEAAKEIRVQTADWNAYRNKLASAVAESSAAKEEAPHQAASGKISAPAEDKGAAPSSGPHDVVKLSKGEVTPEKAAAAAETKGTAKGGKPDAHDKAAMVEEEAIAREKALKEANDKAASLEKQVQEMQKLLEMKNQAAADLQKNAAAQKAEPVKPVVAPAAPLPPTAPIVKPEPIAPPAVDAKPEMAKPDAEKPKHKPKKVIPPPVVEPSLIDTLMDNLPLAGGLLVALGGAGWLVARRKSKKNTDADAQISPAMANATTGSAAVGDTSFLTDFSAPAGGGMIDTSDVDPISEAEVYMAYGRDAQAEEILKDAIKKDPKRYELHVKLLEIYANRNDKNAFEPWAAGLFSTPGTNDPIWAKVVELGRRVDPDNPRYASETADVAMDTPEDMEATQILQVAEPSATDGEMGAAPDLTLDFSLDAGTDEGTESAKSPDSNTVDFDMGALGGADSGMDEMVALEMPADETEVPSLQTSDGNSMEFNLEMPGDDAVALEMPSAEPESNEVADLHVFDSGIEMEALPEISEALPALQEEPAAETAGFDFSLELPEPAAAENVQLDATDLGMEILPEVGLPEIEQASMESADVPAMEMEPASLDEAGVGIEELPELDDPTAQNVSDDMALELPEMAADEAAEEISLDDELAPLEDASNELELVLPEFDVPETDENTEPAEPVVEEMAFELPNAEDFLVEETPEPDAEPVAEEPVMKALDELPSLTTDEATDGDVDFEKTMIMQVPPAKEAPVSMDETIVMGTDGVDLDMDTDTGDSKPVPEIDLSGIDLELGNGGKPAAEAASDSFLETLNEEEITLTAGAESADVDTKLDLVTAYLDMGDKEGARELLQEVLDEGGPQQRERAQKMMDTLD